MCDYSLGHLQSRKAEVGDKLVRSQFAHGFVRPRDDTNASSLCMTCLKAGTRVTITIGAGLPFVSGKTYKNVQVGRIHGTGYNDVFLLPREVAAAAFNLQHGGAVPMAYMPVGTKVTVMSIPGVKPVVKAKAKPKAKPKKQTLEAKLGLDKLNAKITTAKDPAGVPKRRAAAKRRAPAA